MRCSPRKTAPRVRDGKVQRKNRTDLSPSYWNHRQDRVVIDRLRPGEGHRHYLKKRDEELFLGILPDWKELSRGLDAVILDTAIPGTLGWYDDGIVAVCAWHRELSSTWGTGFVEGHADILDRLGVEAERKDPDRWLVHWTEPSIKAFQLLDVLLHELGHHHDLMTTRTQRECGRGEMHAERYARKYAETIWDHAFEIFDG